MGRTPSLAFRFMPHQPFTPMADKRVLRSPLGLLSKRQLPGFMSIPTRPVIVPFSIHLARAGIDE